MTPLEAQFQHIAQDFAKAGLPLGNVVRLTINTRLRSSLGRCRKVQGGYAIELKADLDASVLPDVLAHEMIHTLPGCMNHGPAFRQAAKSLLPYGYHVETRFHPEKYGLKEEEREYPYVLRCRSCGQTISRRTKSALVKHPERYVCGVCRGKLERIR